MEKLRKFIGFLLGIHGQYDDLSHQIAQMLPKKCGLNSKKCDYLKKQQDDNMHVCMYVCK